MLQSSNSGLDSSAECSVSQNTHHSVPSCQHIFQDQFFGMQRKDKSRSQKLQTSEKGRVTLRLYDALGSWEIPVMNDSFPDQCFSSSKAKPVLRLCFKENRVSVRKSWKRYSVMDKRKPAWEGSLQVNLQKQQQDCLSPLFLVVEWGSCWWSEERPVTASHQAD